jgi:pimeloyl-ACP methyl ester carboxylesterase
VPPNSMPDVIVCIPGITGSVLRKDGKDIWNISGSAIFDALKSLGGSFQELKLEDDPVDADDVDGVQATSVIRDVHLIPGIWQIDGYTKLVNHIQANFAAKLNENLFEFAYDWRRDNRVASRQLATKARRWLDTWRTKSGNPDARLILIGHSMGGLVARHFLECREGWRDTRQLITIATPYGGALGSVGTLVNGKKIKFFDLTDVARSLTALYQLLPVYPCYDDGSGKLQRVAEATIPNLDQAKAKAALDFHLEIRAAVEQHLKDQEYLDNRYDIRPIVGIKQPTAQSAILDGTKVKLLQRHGTEDLQGDGTVPRPSATPVEFKNHDNEIYGAERHASLQNGDDVLFQLDGILTAPSFDPKAYRDARTNVEQSLDIADWATPSEPIQVRTKPLGDPGGLLVVNVQNVDTGDELPRVPFRPGDDGWQEAEVGPLPEGVYRITSMGGSVDRVTDLVTVVDE